MYDIGQRQMQPSPVIPKQPSNGLVLGLAPSLESLPVVTDRRNGAMDVRRNEATNRSLK